MRGFEASGSALAEISPASFPLPTFGPVLRNLLRELLDDRGFFMLRGLPNWPEPERHRHLLLWLAPREARPLPEIFAPRYGSVVPGRRSGIVVRGTTLKAPLEAE
ncbi:MAG TPA: hypothetical protein VLD36_21230 [Burkholderiales bacterium]|nr:hypothetical protein [Burkholderiales bacterium]